MNRFVYADNAATTAISKPVLEAMMPYLTTEYGNASSLYELGGRAKTAVNTARQPILARFIFPAAAANQITGLCAGWPN